MNKKEESEIATKSVIKQDERNAETLFSLETKLCICFYLEIGCLQIPIPQGPRRCGQAESFGPASSSMPGRDQPLPPSPLHLLRSHSSPLTAVTFSDDNERIYSADSSGKVVVTSSRTLRAITIWNAHKESILGVEEWDDLIITSGSFYFNPYHVFKLILVK